MTGKLLSVIGAVLLVLSCLVTGAVSAQGGDVQLQPLVKLAPAFEGDIADDAMVTLHIFIIESGRVEKARVVSSSGLPDMALRAIVNSLRGWKFLPLKANGEEATADGMLTFRVESERGHLTLELVK